MADGAKEELEIDAQRKAQLGDLAFRNIEAFAFPATDWEASTFAAVAALPRVRVTRPPVDKLLAAGMVPYDCHANCAAQEVRDSDQLTRHVCGWIFYGSDLILHSVVERNGIWLCLTPQITDAPSRFEFIPDPLITWSDWNEDNSRDALRGGVRLPVGLRRYPEDHLRMRDKFRESMASGLSAFEARELVDATLGVELRKLRSNTQ